MTNAVATEHQRPTNLIKILSRNLHYVCDPICQRTIKKDSKAVNRDWVKHQAYSLSHMLYPFLL